MRLHIVDRFDFEVLQALKANQNVQTYFYEDAFSDLELAEIVILRSTTKVDATFLEKAKNLKLIVTATSGFDHIDLDLCTKRSIVCCYCPDANAVSAAEHAMALILSVQKNILLATKQLRQGKWRDGLKTKELAGKRLGVIGLGRVGSKLAKMAQGFSLAVSAFDPYVDPQVFDKLGVEQLSLEECLKTSDIVSLHVPLTKETHRMIRKPTLEYMSESSILINTSRGEVVFEEDLIWSLNQHKIAYAALDVMESEPLPLNHRLRNCENLLLTPHIGGSSQEALYKASSIAAQKVLDYISDTPVTDTLPPQAPWYTQPRSY